MAVDPAVLGPFAVAAAAIAVSPGPDTMLILRYALTSGRSVGFAAVAGVQLGLFVHTALAIAGVSALIASSPSAFRGLALAGALYLGWLGMRGFFGGDGARIGAGEGGTAWQASRAALLCNVLNPKVIVLFLALYPNFLRLERGDVALQTATLSVVLVAINTGWQTALVWGADTTRRWLSRPDVARAVRWTTSAVLLAFAVAMLIEHAS